jgi:NADH-quinone oxidoreductase subunit E
MAFSEKLREQISEIILKSHTRQSGLIPALHLVQEEYGWISEESMLEIAAILEIPPSKVQNVATFYTMFFTEPVGKHIIWQCRTLTCALRGAENVEHYLTEKLGIGIGETTPDGKVTLIEAECLASCGTAPVMLVDEDLHENLTREKIDEIIRRLQTD